jgi:hypothetical protein
MYPQTVPQLGISRRYRYLWRSSPAHLGRGQAQNLSYQAEPSDFRVLRGVARYLSFPSPKLSSWLGTVPAATQDEAMTLHTFQTSTEAAADPVHQPDAGFELGWDYAHYGTVPPADHLHPLSPVRQGWEAGKDSFGRRTLQANRFTRKWLQLRLNAWLRGRVFDSQQVNPTLLRQIDVAVCPVTRETLTHGSGQPSDASVDRVLNDAAYAVGNLAVMSTRANRAKSAYGVDDAMAFLRQIEVGRLGQIDGLSAEQWARIAVLTSFATPMPHAKAAHLPLLVLPPNRLRVLNPVQSIQVMLSLQFTRAGHARRCAALAGLMPSAEARHAFNTFMHTLLARRLAAGRIAAPLAERHAVEDLWRDPLINQRWQRLALRLTADDCERIGRVAADRGLAGSGVRWLTADSATDGWALESSGYTVAQHCQPALGQTPSPNDGRDNALPAAGHPWGSLFEPVDRQTSVS